MVAGNLKLLQFYYFKFKQTVYGNENTKNRCLGIAFQF
jgi:hypothetical protein